MLFSMDTYTEVGGVAHYLIFGEHDNKEANTDTAGTFCASGRTETTIQTNNRSKKAIL